MDNTYEHIMDTLTHKQYVLVACSNLIKYLIENNRQDDAIQLAIRCGNHDNSKLSDEELYLFAKLPLKRDTLKDPNKKLNDNVLNVTKIHWKNNSHHPEHFNDYHQMSEIDIMEMVCDWYARSLEYGTNLLNFVETRQENRFHFDKNFYDKVAFYCKIVLH